MDFQSELIINHKTSGKSKTGRQYNDQKKKDKR